MKFEKHCERTLAVVGGEFPHVHSWLDAFAWREFGFDPHHRKYRHHREGVEQVRAMWGHDAARAAERHILDDLFGPNVDDVELIPKNQAEFDARLGAPRVQENR